MSGSEYRCVRVYVSTSFHGCFAERQILQEQVFPKLRSWCDARRIVLVATDLRFGTNDDKSTVEAALEEINRADVFVGVLGQEYGARLLTAAERPYLAPPDPEFAWLASVPSGRSLQELEACRVALNAPEDRSPTVRRALFYPRSEVFLDDATVAHRHTFLDGSVEQSTTTGEVVGFTPDEERATLLTDLVAAVRAAALGEGGTPPAVQYDSDGEEVVTESKVEDPDAPLQQGAIRFLPTPYTCAFRPPADKGETVAVTALEGFADRVAQDLMEAVEALYPTAEPRLDDPLTLARVHHGGVAVTAGDGLVGRASLVDKLMAGVAMGPDGPGLRPVLGGEDHKDDDVEPTAHVVFGDPGVGKTAVAAAVVTRLEAAIMADKAAAAKSAKKRPRAATRRGSLITSGDFHTLSPNASLFAHFVGSYPGTDDARGLLQRLCRELARAMLSGYRKEDIGTGRVAAAVKAAAGVSAGGVAGAERAVDWVTGIGVDGATIGLPGDSIPPGDGMELRRLLFGLLAVVCATRTVFIVIDGVDMVRPLDGVDYLSWLPDVDQLPPNLHLILTCRQEGGPASAAAVLQDKGFSTVVVPRLSSSDAKELLSSLLARRGLALEPAAVDAVVARRDGGRPSFLTVVADELRNVAAATADLSSLALYVDELPETTLDVLAQFLDRLSGEHGAGAVGLVLSTLLCVMKAPVGGCQEDELAALSALPGVTWSRLRCDLRTHFTQLYTAVLGGADQLVAIANRDLITVATQRYLPFDKTASPGDGPDFFSNAHGVVASTHLSLAAFYIARARGASVRDAQYWTTRPDDAVRVFGPATPDTADGVLRGLPHVGPDMEIPQDPSSVGVAGLEVGKREEEAKAVAAMAAGLLKPPTIPETLDTHPNSSSRATTGGRVGQWVYGTPAGRRGLRAAAAHLMFSRRIKAAVALLTDIGYLEAVAEAGCVFEAGDNAAAILRVLSAAVDRKAAAMGAAASFAGGSSVRSGRRPSRPVAALSPTNRGMASLAEASALDEHLAATGGGPGSTSSTSDQVVALRMMRVMLEALQHMKALVKRHGAKWSLHPVTVFQTAANEPDLLPAAKQAADLRSHRLEVRPFLAYVNKPQSPAPCVMTLRGHRKGGVTCLSFARRGGFLVSGGDDGRALMWDIGSTVGDDVVAVLDAGDLPATSTTDAGNRFQVGSTARVGVTAVAIHPQRNGIVLVGLADGRILLWDAAGDIAKEVFSAGEPGARAHDDPVTCIQWHLDGTHVLTGDGDGFVTLWEYPDDQDAEAWDAEQVGGHPEARLTWRAHTHAVTRLAFMERVDLGRPGYQGSVELPAAPEPSFTFEPFSRSAWAAAAEAQPEPSPALGEVGLVVTCGSTRVSVWDGPWDDLGTTATASAGLTATTTMVLTAEEGKESEAEVLPGGPGAASGAAKDGVKATVKTSNLDCPSALSTRVLPGELGGRRARAGDFGVGPGNRALDGEVVRVGGLSVPPLGLDVTDNRSAVSCLVRATATQAVKLVGPQSLLPQNPGTRGEALLTATLSRAPLPDTFARSPTRAAGGSVGGLSTPPPMSQSIVAPAGVTGGASVAGGRDLRLAVREDRGGLLLCGSMSSRGRIAAGCSDNTVRVYRDDTGSRVATMYGHAAPVTAVAYSPDGALLASASKDGNVKLWTPQVLAPGTRLQPHSKPVSVVGVCRSTGLGRMVTVSTDGQAKVWNTKTGRTTSGFNTRTRTVFDARFLADGRAVATASASGVHLWRLPSSTLADAGGVGAAPTDSPSGGTGVEVTSRQVFSEPVRAWALSPSLGVGAVVAADGTGPITLLEFRNGHVVETLPSASAFDAAFPPSNGAPQPLHSSPRVQVMKLEFSRDASMIACGCNDGTMRVWRLSSLHDHAGSVTDLFGKAVSRLGGSTKSLGPSVTPLDPVPRAVKPDSMLVIRERATITTTDATSVADHEVTTLAWSPNQRYVVTLSAAPRGRLWDVSAALKGLAQDGIQHGDNGECMHVLHGHLAGPTQVAWEPQSRYLATAGPDGYLILWDVATRSAANVITRAHAGKPITKLGWSADGRRIVTAGNDNTIRLWRVFPPSAQAAATAEATGRGHVLRVTTQALWTVDTRVTSVGFDPMLQQVVVGDDVGSVQVLRLDEAEGITPLELEENEAEATAYGPDGEAIVLGSEIGANPPRPRAPATDTCRMYIVEKQQWESKPTSLCHNCGNFFTPPPSALSASSTLRECLRSTGPLPHFFKDPRLLLRCTRCVYYHRITPFVWDRLPSVRKASNAKALALREKRKAAIASKSVSADHLFPDIDAKKQAANKRSPKGGRHGGSSFLPRLGSK